MFAQLFRGTGVAIVTPFLENGSIDWEALERLLQHLDHGQVDYLVVMGTTGESVTLTKEEKQQVFSFVARHNASKRPLVAGIGGNNTAEVVSALQHTNLEGYQGILSVSPYYNKPNQEGLLQHHKAINDASPLPVIMYNVPGRTGMNVSVQTTLRIARECPNIIATKEASGNMEQIMQILAHKPAGFEVISGDDSIALPLIACGAIGVISVVANAYPGTYSRMIRMALDGKYESARPVHLKFLDIISSLFEEGNPSGVKVYLSEMGICGNYFRLPVYPVSRQLQEKIRGLMKTLEA
jgi:4-hydroxy-tetrahydrodipicolinate synthase